MTTASSRVSSEEPSATCLGSSSLCPPGSAAVATAPTNGTTISRLSQGKSFISGSPRKRGVEEPLGVPSALCAGGAKRRRPPGRGVKRCGRTKRFRGVSSSEVHRQEGHDDQHGAGEQGQGVGADEAGL